MTEPTFPIPQANSQTATEEPKIITALAQIKNILDGNIDADNAADTGWITQAMISSSLLALIGANESGAIRRAFISIDDEEARSSSSFGTLTTPDMVEDVEVPDGALVRIGYRALWKSASVVTASRAALFIGSDQLKVRKAEEGTLVTQAASFENSQGTNSYAQLSSCDVGLIGGYGTGPASDATTGQVLGVYAPPNQNNLGCAMAIGDVNVTDQEWGPQGGMVELFVAAGTYDFSVQFKNTGGSAVTVKERRMYLEVVPFDI